MGIEDVTGLYSFGSLADHYPVGCVNCLSVVTSARSPVSMTSSASLWWEMPDTTDCELGFCPGSKADFSGIVLEDEEKVMMERHCPSSCP